MKTKLFAVLGLLFCLQAPALAGVDPFPLDIPPDEVSVVTLKSNMGQPYSRHSVVTLQDGTASVVGAHPDGSIDVLFFPFPPGNAVKSITVDTGGVIENGNIQVNNGVSFCNIQMFQPVNGEGQTHVTNNPMTQIQGQVNQAGPNIEIRMYLLGTNLEIPLNLIPGAGFTDFQTDIFNFVGIRNFVVTVRDLNDPFQPPCEFEFQINFQPVGLQLHMPAYIAGGPESYQSAARAPRCERFGNTPQATTDCCGCPSPRRPFTAIDANDGYNVNLAEGRFYYCLSALTLPGKSLPIDFRLSYNSHLLLPGGHVLGNASWSHSYVRALFPDGGGGLIRFDGSEVRTDQFNLNGSFYEATGYPALIRQNVDNSFTLRHANGMKEHYFPLDGSPEQGRLFMIEDANLQPNSIQIGYGTGLAGEARIDSITDSYGRDAITFNYDGVTGLLTDITDLEGRTVQFNFNGAGELDGVTSPTGPEFPTGRTYQFGYANGLLTGITYPNEVEAGLPEPRIELSYNGGSPTVQTQKVGGTNASGTAAGGVITFDYLLRGGLTPYTAVTDRNGNVTEYDFDPAGLVVTGTEFDKGLRTDGPYVTTYTYTLDGFLTGVTKPEGNSTTLIYDLGASRFQIGNVINFINDPGPRGGDQNQIEFIIDYEDLFNQPIAIIDPRESDPFFIPPFGSGVTPGRYTTFHFYAYQEGDSVPAAEQGWGISENDLDLDLGDLNGNGTTSDGCSVIIRTELPAQTLPDGSTQQRVHTFEYNPFGQKTKETDAGGVTTIWDYFPEDDPAGTGNIVPGRDPVTGGFLKDVTKDADPGSIYTIQIPITTSNAWNRIGDPVFTIDGRGIRSSYDYNEIHLPITITEADDTTANPGRPNENLPVPPLTIIENFDYDANDNTVKVEKDNRDNDSIHAGAFIETRSIYDILDQVIRIEDEDTDTTFILETFEYDANENQVRSEREHAMEFEDVSSIYDSRDLLFSETRGSGGEASTQFFFIDLNGNDTGFEDAVDNDFGVGLPGDGNPESTEKIYDGYDRVIESTDRLGNRTEYDYDPAGNIAEQRFYGHPPNQPISPPILMGVQQSWHDEANHRVFDRHQLFVDAGQNPQRTPVLDTDDAGEPDFVIITYWFDPNGLATRISNPNEAQGLEEIFREYDGHRRLIERTDAEGNKVEYAYNNNDRPTRVTETDVQPDGLTGDEVYVTRNYYDALDRLTRTTDNDGHTTRFLWGTLFETEKTDAEGPNLISDPDGGGLINDDGNRTTTRRDGLGRTVQVDRELTTTGQGGAGLDTSNPDNSDGKNTTTIVYDDANRKVMQTDDRGNTTTTTRDTRGNVTRVDWADGTATTYQYNLDDDPVQVVDPNGSTIDQGYDPLGRLFERDVIPGTGVMGTTRQEYGYDGMSRATRSLDDDGIFQSAVESRYDSLGNRIEEVQNGRIVSREYKSFSDPVRLVYPDSTKVNLRTDRIGRITRVGQGGRAAGYDYIGRWRNWSRLNGPGASGQSRTDYTWDAARRLTGVDHEKISGGTIAEYAAGYNREHRMLWQERVHDGGVGEQFDLDSAYRALGYRDGVANPSGGAGVGTILKESWVLDGVGNWNEKTTNEGNNGDVTFATTVNSMNEYSVFDGGAQTHDDNGNRLTDDRYLYAYDFANRLREVREQGSGDLVATYDYDALGRRTRKVTGSIVTHFAWDGPRMIEETKPNGTLRARTLFGQGMEPVKRVIPGAAMIGVQRAVLSGPGGGNQTLRKELYYHEDAKGWIAAVTDRSGNVKERYRYSAYGEPTFLNASGSVVANQKEDNPWIYHGYYRDAETGLYYALHRYNDPQTGRWLSRDPLGYHDSMNLYEFVQGEPGHFIDPFGLEALTLTAYAKDHWNPLKNGSNKGLGMSFIRNAKAWWSTNDIYFSDLKSLADELEKKVGKYDPCGKNGNCIKSLEILQHGAGGKNQIFIGSTSIDSTTISKLSEERGRNKEIFDNLNRIKKLLCCCKEGEYAFIDFRQCGGYESLDEVGQRLATILNGKVKVYETPVNPDMDIYIDIWHLNPMNWSAGKAKTKTFTPKK